MLFRADFHIHTVLSPCASLEMSPINIIDKALDMNLDIIAITDHNSTRQAILVNRLAEKRGLKTLLGVEVCSKEEVHILALFETEYELNQFQLFIDEVLVKVPNRADIMGDQVVVDEFEQIIYCEEFWLGGVLNASLELIRDRVKELNGLFIPAHIDRPANGLLSTLGFIPKGIDADAYELSSGANCDKYDLDRFIVTGSDSHYIDTIGSVTTDLELDELSFKSIKDLFNRYRVNF